MSISIYNMSSIFWTLCIECLGGGQIWSQIKPYCGHYDHCSDSSLCQACQVAGLLIMLVILYFWVGFGGAFLACLCGYW